MDSDQLDLDHAILSQTKAMSSSVFTENSYDTTTIQPAGDLGNINIIDAIES